MIKTETRPQLELTRKKEDGKRIVPTDAGSGTCKNNLMCTDVGIIMLSRRR